MWWCRARFSVANHHVRGKGAHLPGATFFTDGQDVDDLHILQVLNKCAHDSICSFRCMAYVQWQSLTNCVQDAENLLFQAPAAATG